MNVRARELHRAVTLSEREAEVHRCACCGGWVLGERPCATGCATQVARAAA